MGVAEKGREAGVPVKNLLIHFILLHLTQFHTCPSSLLLRAVRRVTGSAANTRIESPCSPVSDTSLMAKRPEHMIGSRNSVSRCMNA